MSVAEDRRRRERRTAAEKVSLRREAIIVLLLMKKRGAPRSSYREGRRRIQERMGIGMTDWGMGED